MFNERIFYGFSLAIRALYIMLAFCDDDLVFSSRGGWGKKLFLDFPSKRHKISPAKKNGKFFENHLKNFPLKVHTHVELINILSGWEREEFMGKLLRNFLINENEIYCQIKKEKNEERSYNDLRKRKGFHRSVRVEIRQPKIFKVFFRQKWKSFEIYSEKFNDLFYSFLLTLTKRNEFPKFIISLSFHSLIIHSLFRGLVKTFIDLSQQQVSIKKVFKSSYIFWTLENYPEKLNSLISK